MRILDGRTRVTLLIVFFGLFCGFTPQAFSQDSQPPNIILLLIENISTDLGCYGYPTVKTPNIDKLASQGIRYTHAFVTSSMCTTSRSALALGAYEIRTNTHHHLMNDHRTLPEPYRIFTEYLHRKKYYTVLGGFRKEINYGMTDKLNINFKPKESAFKGSDYKERSPGQPFFIQCTLHITHRGPQFKKIDPSLPLIKPEDVVLPEHIPDHPVCRLDWAEYLMQIQKMDAQVGRIMKHLDDEGLTDNTLVILMADNGRDHQRGMEWVYDDGIHVPLIVRGPGVEKPGTVCNDMVSSVDVTATILSSAGIEVPKHMDGIPFLGPKAGKRDYIYASRDRIRENLDRIRCVRSKNFKYICNFMPEKGYPTRSWVKTWDKKVNLMQEMHAQGKLTQIQGLNFRDKKPEEEFYDVKNDPNEYHNLAKDPKFANELQKMRRLLDQWIKDTNDAGRFQEKRNEFRRTGENDQLSYDEVYPASKVETE